MRDLSVAVLYPYPGLPGMERGTARRVVPLISFLAEHFARVRVLCPRPAAADFGRAEFVPVPESSGSQRLLELAFRFYDGVAFHGLRRPDVRARRQWWNFIRPLLDRDLRRALRSASAGADAIMLEYPFWSRALEGAMRPRKPVLLTMHDLLAPACGHPWLARRVHRCEMAAARRADAVVCVTPEETASLRAEGIAASYVPHGFVLDRAAASPHGEPDDPAIKEVARLVGEGASLCLFLGSSHLPNRDAAGRIFEIARNCPRDSGLLFVVAGSCSGPSRPHENAYSLGPVSEKDLGILYALSRIALAPLESGTGASLKVVEAMAERKTLVATNTGIRGYPGIRDGEQAIVCDDLSAWPEKLVGLVRDRARMDAIAASGREFARAFDYKNVYRPYVDILETLAPSDR